MADSKYAVVAKLGQERELRLAVTTCIELATHPLDRPRAMTSVSTATTRQGSRSAERGIPRRHISTSRQPCKT